MTWYMHSSRQVTECSISRSDIPVVVIDPEDREQVERLVGVFSSQRDWWADTRRQRSNAMQAALREFANPKPPKPEEPTGLGAVVEDVGDVWIKTETEGAGWCPSGGSGTVRYRCWGDFSPAVRVLSDGLT